MEKGQVVGPRFRSLTSKGRGHGASLPHYRTVQTQHSTLACSHQPDPTVSHLSCPATVYRVFGWLAGSFTYCYKEDSPHQALGLGIQGRGSEDLHSLDEEAEA